MERGVERLDHDIGREGPDGFDFRKFLAGGAAEHQPEEVVETLFASVEDFVHLHHHRGRIGPVGFDREVFDDRLPVVVAYRTGDRVAGGRGDARVEREHPYLFISGVLTETDDPVGIFHAFVQPGVVQGVGNARYLVDEQDVAAHQRIGNLEIEIVALAVHVKHAPVGRRPFEQVGVSVFLFLRGIRGGGFRLFFRPSQQLGLRPERSEKECGRQQDYDIASFHLFRAYYLSKCNNSRTEVLSEKKRSECLYSKDESDFLCSFSGGRRGSVQRKTEPSVLTVISWSE